MAYRSHPVYNVNFNFCVWFKNGYSIDKQLDEDGATIDITIFQSQPTVNNLNILLTRNMFQPLWYIVGHIQQICSCRKTPG